jgi:hypothetical protein
VFSARKAVKGVKRSQWFFYRGDGCYVLKQLNSKESRRNQAGGTERETIDLCL